MKESGALGCGQAYRAIYPVCTVGNFSECKAVGARS
jgi:hypothetical protein